MLELVAQSIVSGIAIGCVYGLIGIGFCVIYNASGIVNFAQGAFVMLGGMVGCQNEAAALVEQLEQYLADIRRSAARFPVRLKTFFEEWDDPLISGIRWVEELVEIAGGDPIFPHLRNAALAKNRIVQPAAVREAQPDVILASWCGKKVRKATITKRDGWATLPAVRDRRVYEIKSTYILQPGPASLTEGVRQIHYWLCRAAGVDVPASLQPAEAVDPITR